MNEFDQFMKHELKVKHYVRYTDDFALVADSPEYLRNCIPPITAFLADRLALRLHPQKIITRSLYQGIDFLGYVIFSKHRLLRTKTKRRIFAKLARRVAEHRAGRIPRSALEQSLQSYLGVLSHADSHKLKEELLNWYWFELAR